MAREEWAKRVERWCESGLTAAEFAAELGINARTLTYWKWVLGREARGEKRAWPARKARRRKTKKAVTASQTAPAFVELSAVATDERFELELGAGRRLRVPKGFDAEALRRLLGVLEAS